MCHSFVLLLPRILICQNSVECSFCMIVNAVTWHASQASMTDAATLSANALRNGQQAHYQQGHLAPSRFDFRAVPQYRNADAALGPAPRRPTTISAVAAAYGNSDASSQFCAAQRGVHSQYTRVSTTVAAAAAAAAAAESVAAEATHRAVLATPRFQVSVPGRGLAGADAERGEKELGYVAFRRDTPDRLGQQSAGRR